MNDECCRREDGKESQMRGRMRDEPRKGMMKGILMQGSPHTLMIPLINIIAFF